MSNYPASTNKFASMAQMQYMKGKKSRIIPISEIQRQLEKYVNMDNLILKAELSSQGYTSDKIDVELNKKFKPTIENIVKLLIDLKRTNKRQIDFLSKIDQMLGEQEFLQKINIEQHIINREGVIHLSETLFTILMIKLTEIGFSLGLYIIENLKTDLDRHLPIAASGELSLEDANAYNGYAKATYVNLTDMLVDFSFLDEHDVNLGLIPEYRHVLLEHEGMQKALSGIGYSPILKEDQVQPDKIQFFEKFAPSDESESILPPTGLMEELGFSTTDRIGKLELLSFFSLNLIPTNYLIALIHQGLVRVVINHVSGVRGSDFKFESLEIEGSKYKEFYNVLASNCVRTRHENKALRLDGGY